MLGASVFLIQAGAAEILLRSDRICQEARQANWAYNPQGCQPEGVRYLLRGLAHGILGAVLPDTPAALSVLSMAALVGVVSVFLALLPARRAVPAFLALEVLAAVGFGMLGFMLLYVG
jgi:hypothetical protein